MPQLRQLHLRHREQEPERVASEMVVESLVAALPTVQGLTSLSFDVNVCVSGDTIKQAMHAVLTQLPSLHHLGVSPRWFGQDWGVTEGQVPPVRSLHVNGEMAADKEQLHSGLLSQLTRLQVGSWRHTGSLLHLPGKPVGGELPPQRTQWLSNLRKLMHSV